MLIDGPSEDVTVDYPFDMRSVKDPIVNTARPAFLTAAALFVVVLAGCGEDAPVTPTAEVTPQQTSPASEPSVGMAEAPANATTTPSDGTPEAAEDTELSVMVASKLVGFAFLPEDLSAGRYSDHVVVDFEHRNTSDRTIRAVTGVAVFKDLFEREIRSVRLTYTDPIEPGAAAVDSGRTLELNQFMESDSQLGSKTLDQIIFSFDVSAVLWSDGTLEGEVPDAYVPASGPAREQLAGLLRVDLQEVAFVPENWNAGLYSDHLSFVFEYANTTDQDIRAFTGQAVFLDLFGREIKRMGLTYDSVLPVGSSITDADKSFELNQFIGEDQLLATTEQEDLQFVFEVDSVIFADGTRLGSAR